ncbi:MerC domain-containing protein [Brevundimonas sp.]|jgi:hypothetical protein|uniref:MerC domain-containing protein n=1 Tax=Brevundimonas sp. TaxID=1871086 RepID=UPI0037C19571
MSCETVPATRTAGLADAAGVGLSALCALHCLLLPIIASFLPAFSAGEAAWVHWAFAVAALAAAAGLFSGEARPLVAGLAIIGLFLLFDAAVRPLTRAGETLLTLSGGSALAVAHLLNLWPRRRSSDDYPQPLDGSNTL